MNDQQDTFAVTIELRKGERLLLPPELVEKVGPGRWLVTIRPSEGPKGAPEIRRHDAFLSGYAAEDEGLYDELALGEW